jgi:glucose-6-phosphate 1-epimerase
MEETSISGPLQRHEIPGRIKVAASNGGLSKVVVTTNVSAAEIYLHGAHVTGFQKNGELPLLFLSRLSRFAPGESIRGGVPICFPWFGSREGDVAHGFARLSEWELTKASAAADGAVTLHFRLPEIPGRATWKGLRTDFVVTVSDRLTMELMTTNDSPAAMDMENCLHSYFYVGDIGDVKICGLKGMYFLDKTENFARKLESGDALKIVSETDRVFPDATGAVEIHDAKLHRAIHVRKSGSTSAVVWNPWIAKAGEMPDFDPAEYQNMVCVESGNVGRNKITLTPGNTSTLRVELGCVPLP